MILDITKIFWFCFFNLHFTIF